MIEINADYIFNTNAIGIDNEIMEEHYDDGRLSDEVWNAHDFWTDLNHTEVTVISVITSKKTGSCDEWAKVFIKSHGFEWWFSAHVNELTLSSKNNPRFDGACTCDLGLIMVRGCQCGGN